MKKRNCNGYYIPVPRLIFQHNGFAKLSVSAKLLFFYLLELEHRYSGENRNYFYRSNEELANDTGLSVRTIQKAKDEFKEYIPDLISMAYVHWWIDEEHTKQSKKKVTSYTIKI